MQDVTVDRDLKKIITLCKKLIEGSDMPPKCLNSHKITVGGKSELYKGQKWTQWTNVNCQQITTKCSLITEQSAMAFTIAEWKDEIQAIRGTVSTLERFSKVTDANKTPCTCSIINFLNAYLRKIILYFTDYTCR